MPGFGVASSVYHLYVVRLERRDRVLKALNARGIGAGIHYLALHELEAYSSLGYRPGSFAVAEDWARRCFSLPVYPELTPEQVDICAPVRSATVGGTVH